MIRYFKIIFIVFIFSSINCTFAQEAKAKRLYAKVHRWEDKIRPFDKERTDLLEQKILTTLNVIVTKYYGTETFYKALQDLKVYGGLTKEQEDSIYIATAYKTVASPKMSQAKKVGAYYLLASHEMKREDYKKALEYAELSVQKDMNGYCGNAIEQDGIDKVVLFANCYKGLNQIDTALKIIESHIQGNDFADNSSAVKLWAALLKTKWGKEEFDLQLETAIKSVYIDRDSFYDDIILPFAGQKLDLVRVINCTFQRLSSLYSQNEIPEEARTLFSFHRQLSEEEYLKRWKLLFLQSEYYKLLTRN